MQTGSIQISDIPSEVLRALTERAQEQGKTPADYVRELIEADILARVSKIRLTNLVLTAERSNVYRSCCRKKLFSSGGAQCARIAQTFRSSGAFKVGVDPQFYKHFVPLGLKTTTENQNCLYCDNFKNGTLELRPSN